MTANDPRLKIAMEQPDFVSLLVRYVDPDGKFSIRVISPFHADGRNVMAFCATRGDYRTFELSRLLVICLVWSFTVFAPQVFIQLECGFASQARKGVSK